MAYGVDKLPPGDPAAAHDAAEAEATTLHDRLARVETRVPATELEALRADLAALEAKVAARAREVA